MKFNFIDLNPDKIKKIALVATNNAASEKTNLFLAMANTSELVNNKTNTIELLFFIFVIVI
jgi:hypothetical protein